VAATRVAPTVTILRRERTIVATGRRIHTGGGGDVELGGQMLGVMSCLFMGVAFRWSAEALRGSVWRKLGY